MYLFKLNFVLLITFLCSNVFGEYLPPLHLQSFFTKQLPDESHTYVPRADVGFYKYLSRSIYGTNKVVLTYDDGPHPTNTPKLLDILRDYDVKATFFILGSRVNSKTIPIIERMLLEGHHVASHDWTHTDTNLESESLFEKGLSKSIKTIEQIEANLGIHKREIYYRFPYGAYGTNKNYHHLNVMKILSQELYGENCINFAFWDVDTADWVSNMTSDNIAQTIIANIHGGEAYDFKRVYINGRPRYRKKQINITNPIGGGVILMHDIHAKSVMATLKFLKRHREEGIEVIPLDQVDEFSYGNQSCVYL